MRSMLLISAAIAALVVAGPASAQNFRKPPAADKAALKLDADSIESRSGTKVYVVQMAAKPGIAYAGGVTGLARTAPVPGAKYDARSSQAQIYTGHLAVQQYAMLASIGASDRMIYSYRHAINGFAARLTAAEADKLRKNKEVLRVWEDRRIPVETNNSPRFLGLRDEKIGLYRKHGLTGKDVVIGVIDSGAVQEHPSFDGSTYKEAPKDWHGICQAGEGWAETDCNNKLIGARYFVDGFLGGQAFDDVVVPGEFFSARDSDGHGTHTATTAGGNAVKASLAGQPLVWINGMAHRARIAIYKACWQAPGAPSASCTFSDSAAATDAAVADGVDVINFSVGTAAAFNDPQDIAFLFAADAGVFVARSAGNSGPTSAAPAPIAAGEPWVTSVGASTHSGTAFAQSTLVNSPASVAGNFPSLEGAITKPLAFTGPITNDVVAADPLDACTPIAPIAGKIALIARGACVFSDKITNAANAGAMAVLMYTAPPGNPKTVMGGVATPVTQSIPGVMIDNEPGVAILAALNGGATVNATLSASNFIKETLTGNVMAGFSSRGPFPTETDWIKPDVTAPGVRVLAGHTPEPNDGSAGDFYQYLQGTSMSSPHVAGIAALLKQKHKTWTPAMIKSALMTTARQNIVKEDGATPADPFDFGSGHINPNKAIDPGLVYDAGFLDYLAASCGTVSPLVSGADCGVLESLGFSQDPADLNLPSIGVGALPGVQTIHRTVTNVAAQSGSLYEVHVRAPAGYRVKVRPKSFYLHSGQSANYAVTITNVSAPPGEWRFGSLEWRDDQGHRVRSPIAVNAVALVAPEEITGTGADGATSFDVTFGYTGPYTAGAHGLVEPFLTAPIPITDDPLNTFDFNFKSDEPIVYLLELPVGTTYAQWSMFDAYNDKPTHDIDLYLFYCPDFVCTQIDQSFNATSNERVSVTLPVTNGVAADPNDMDDPYLVIAHGFNTAGGMPATSIMFDWTVLGAEGNLSASGPASAAIGQEATINVDWAGLPTGPAEKQVGAVSHSDDTGIKDLTIVNIENDAGGGYCDFFTCP